MFEFIDEIEWKKINTIILNQFKVVFFTIAINLWYTE